MAPSNRSRSAWWSTLAVVLCFGVAMGMLEAICVVYLRQLLLPGDVASLHGPLQRYPIEMWREACTIVMLASVGWLAGKNATMRFGFFLAAFGAWDIVYYAGLYLWAGWPTSLLDWDCLFLIPCPWYGPVLAPVLISAAFIFSCVLLIVGERSGRPTRATMPRVLLGLSGWTAWILSFTVFALPAAGEKHPSHYAWWALLVGMIPWFAATWPSTRPGQDGAGGRK